MLEYVDNAKMMLKEIAGIRAGQKLLVISDTYARSRAITDAVTFHRFVNNDGVYFSIRSFFGKIGIYHPFAGIY